MTRSTEPSPRPARLASEKITECSVSFMAPSRSRRMPCIVDGASHIRSRSAPKIAGVRSRDSLLNVWQCSRYPFAPSFHDLWVPARGHVGCSENGEGQPLLHGHGRIRDVGTG